MHYLIAVSGAVVGNLILLLIASVSGVVLLKIIFTDVHQPQFMLFFWCEPLHYLFQFTEWFSQLLWRLKSLLALLHSVLCSRLLFRLRDINTKPSTTWSDTDVSPYCGRFGTQPSGGSSFSQGWNDGVERIDDFNATAFWNMIQFPIYHFCSAGRDVRDNASEIYLLKVIRLYLNSCTTSTLLC